MRWRSGRISSRWCFAMTVPDVPPVSDADGLIARVADPNDRRSSAAELTPEGRKLIDRAIAVRFAEATEAVSALSEAERVRLAALLKKLGRGLD